MAIVKSIAIFLLSSVLSQAHYHGPHRGQPFRAECVRASNNDTAKTDKCMECFNDSRVMPQSNENVQPESENPMFHRRFSFNYFDSGKLRRCIQENLGADYSDCGDIMSNQTPKITSFRILGCINSRFSESVGRECATKVKADDLDKYFDCKRAAFEI